MCEFCQILCFILKIYHNIESYQNMKLITLGFCFLYHKLQDFFVCHAHYTPFTCGKTRLLKFEIFEKYFKLKKKLIPYFLNCDYFLNVGNRLLSFLKHLPSKSCYYNSPLPSPLKINHYLMQQLLNFKHLLLKPKPKI
jgi:hypothetical protein